MSLYNMTALIILVGTSIFGEAATTIEKSNGLECSTNKDCSGDTLCVEGKCLNPCLLNLCDDPKTCKVTNHIPVCSCDAGFSGVLAESGLFLTMNLRCPDSADSCCQGSIDSLLGAARQHESAQRIPVNWYQAVASCNAMNMRLVTLDSEREYERLVRQIRQSNLGQVDFWTAGTDLTEKGTYLWISTGKPMAYFNFVQGEPNHWTNNGEEEHCIELTQGIDYKMNDDICSTRNFNACEYFE